MNFADLREQLVERLQVLWARIQDSSTYINLKERFDNLTPTGQKLCMAGAALFAVVLILYTPLSYLGTSSDNIDSFISKRELTRKLFKVSRAGTTPLDSANASEIKDRVDNELKEVGLTSAQIAGVQTMSANDLKQITFAGPPIRQEGVQVKLNKLNLKQIIDIGYRLQNIHPAAKLAALNITANAADKHYYDVTMEIATFAVPMSAPPVDKPRGKRK